MDLYVSAITDRVTIPFHRCRATVRLERKTPLVLRFDKVAIKPPMMYQGVGFIQGGPIAQSPDSATVQSTQSEVHFYGPGRVVLEARTDTHPLRTLPKGGGSVKVSLQPADSDASVEFDYPITFEEADDPDVYGRWSRGHFDELSLG